MPASRSQSKASKLLAKESRQKKSALWDRPKLSGRKFQFELPEDRESARLSPKDDDDEVEPEPEPEPVEIATNQPAETKTAGRKTAERLRLRTQLRKSVGENQKDEGDDDVKRWKWGNIGREYAARADGFAAAHTVPKHQVCIAVASAMIPCSMIAMTWDLLATTVFQIPHLSTINSPAFILFLNFVAMPLAMYGYMMEYLMHESSRMAVLGLICVIVHPILFFIRAFFEYIFDGYRNEQKLYFESSGPGEEFEYPIGTFDPKTPVKSAVQ